MSDAKMRNIIDRDLVIYGSSLWTKDGVRLSPENITIKRVGGQPVYFYSASASASAVAPDNRSATREMEP